MELFSSNVFKNVERYSDINEMLKFTSPYENLDHQDLQHSKESEPE